MESTKTRTFDLIDQKLSKKLEDKSERKREEARREIVLCSKSNHKGGLFFKKSKLGGIVSVPVKRGQFFTTHNKLSQIWSCTKKQARGQLARWEKSGVIEVERVKDQKGFDVGLLITYKWLFEREKESQRKKGIRETTQKSRQKGNKKQDENKKGIHKKEVLTKVNIQRKTTKKEVVFSFESDKKFREVAEKLKNIGFKTWRIEKFYKNFSLESLDKYLELFELNREKIKNPCAWLTSALNQSFDLQKVENWRQKQEQERQEEEAREEEAKRERERQERERKRREKEDLVIEDWRQESGEEAENQLYFEVFEDLKKTNLIIYNYLNKKRAGGLNILDMLKKDPFVKGEVRKRILEKVKSNCACLVW